MKTVTKINDFEFEITFPGFSDDVLKLNFLPLVRNYSLDNLKSYVLCHWQAKPKYIRSYGFYDKLTRMYYAVDHNKVDIVFPTAIRTLQLDESIHLTLPTAVLLFPEKKIAFNGNFYQIVNDNS